MIVLGSFSVLCCSKKDPQPLPYDIYIAGNNGGAVYWKNGAPTMLPGGAGCSGIVVVDKDVYVSGLDLTTPSLKLAYWKNSEEHILPLSVGLNSQASSLA